MVADTAAFQSPCNLYDVFANVVNGGSPPVVRDVGPIGFAAPVIATNQLPNLPSFTGGTTTVTVSSNTTLNLAPGSYGGVSVQDDGTLNLAAGTYIVAFLHGGKRAHINTTDTTVVLAAQDISTNNDAVIAPSCLAQFSARSDSVGSNNFTVSFSRNTEAHGQFFAPNGQLNLGDSTDLFGRFVAQSIGSGWNTNVTYCGTGSPITTPTLVPTSTAPPPATPTNTPVPPPSNTATGGPTSVPTVPATSTAPPPLTATVTAVPTDTPSPTCTPTATDTPTATPTATSTPTSTPIPPGVIIGEVYDDGSAQPLADVIAQLTSTNTSTTTDPTGAYTLPAAAGEQAVALTRSGYTRNLRRLSVPPGRGGQLLDGRLTALAAPVTIDGNGGTVRTAYKAPGSPAADVTLGIPSGALTAPAAIQLTVLSPQALIAPLPLGWSVLLGVDLQATSTIANTITLHIPASLLALSGSLPVLAAVWEDATQQWLGGPAVVQVGNAVEITLSAQPSAVSQIALIVADTDPAAPPAAVEGQPIGGVSVLAAAGDSGVVIADPPAIVAGTGAGAQVLTQVHGLEPLSSGTVLNAALRETYDLLDGRSLTGTVADEDIIGYQVSPSTNTSTTLGAYFNLIPSRNYTLSELSAGRVDIDLSLHVAGGDLGVVGPSGGTIDGSGGLHLVVPPNAVGQTTVIRLHPAPPARLPVGVSGRPDLAGTFEIDVNGGALDPDAAYQIDLGTVVNDGDRFAITRLEQDGQGSVLVLIGFGHGANGRIVFDACAPGVTLCLDGLAGNATYAVFTAPAGAAEVTGTVRDSTGPRAGVRVQSATSPVALGATITLTFSEAIAAASITDASVTLTQVGSQQPVLSNVEGSTVESRKSLSTDGTHLLLTSVAPLSANTLYRVSLTAQVTNRAGTALTPFTSDFTTAAVFKADALPPNTLRVSLPDDNGKVFVCGGAQLAAPGTAVVVQNATSQVTYTASATDANGVSGSGVCDALFGGRCDTGAPGSFCTVIAAVIGDRVQVQVQDVLHNTVTLDTGNMRDERTGATVIDTAGGVVTYPHDARYQALIPDGAFTQPTIVQITPITAGGVGLNLADYPVLTTLDQSKIELIGAVKVDLTPPDTVAQRKFDVTVPAAPDAAADDQYIATQVVNFRGADEQTMVDTALFDAARGVIATGYRADFPLMVNAGIFGIHRASACLGYVTGYVTLGDLYNNGYIPAGIEGAQLPFPVLVTDRTRFAVPLPCNQQVDVGVLTLADQPLDDVSILVPDRRQFRELPRPLIGTDNGMPPAITAGTGLNGSSTGIDPLAPVQLLFSKPIIADSATLTLNRCADVACAETSPVAGTWQLSPDGQLLTFVPTVRLRYGTTYSMVVDGVTDGRGRPLPTFTNTFTTFVPQVVGRITAIDARDVVALDQNLLGVPPSERLIAFVDGRGGEDGGTANTVESGVVIYDVTNLPSGTVADLTNAQVALAVTAGVDRALAFSGGPPITIVNADGTARTLAGPFIVSVDGPGGPDRFGVLRLFDLGGLTLGPMTLAPAVSRFLNQSANSYELFNSFDPADPGQSPPPTFLKYIDNQVGLPLGVTVVNTGVAQLAYIANTPFPGIQAVNLADIVNSEFVPQVDGRVTGTYRAVTTLGNNVLAAGQDQNGGKLVLMNPQLVAASGQAAVSDTYGVGGTNPLTITALTGWPARVVTGGVATTAPRDLAVAACQGTSLCVVPVDAAAGNFAPGLLPLGPGQLTTPGRTPRGTAGVASDQLLYVADGTAGLSIVDLADPSGGPRDADGDGIDDRVLGTVNLDGNRALSVAPFRDATGRPIVAVAAAEGGGYLRGDPLRDVLPSVPSWSEVEL